MATSANYWCFFPFLSFHIRTTWRFGCGSPSPKDNPMPQDCSDATAGRAGITAELEQGGQDLFRTHSLRMIDPLDGRRPGTYRRTWNTRAILPIARILFLMISLRAATVPPAIDADYNPCDGVS